MSKRLNPLEKEMLIRLFRNNPSVSISQFCSANGVTVQTFRKWIKLYDEAGIEALATGEKPSVSVLPKGLDRTEENYKREILKLTIENERLKKNYTARRTPDGKMQFQHLEAMNTTSSEDFPDDTR